MLIAFDLYADRFSDHDCIAGFSDQSVNNVLFAQHNFGKFVYSRAQVLTQCLPLGQIVRQLVFIIDNRILSHKFYWLDNYWLQGTWSLVPCLDVLIGQLSVLYECILCLPISVCIDLNFVTQQKDTVPITDMGSLSNTDVRRDFYRDQSCLSRHGLY